MAMTAAGGKLLMTEEWTARMWEKWSREGSSSRGGDGKHCGKAPVMWGRTYTRRHRARDVRRAAERAARTEESRDQFSGARMTRAEESRDQASGECMTRAEESHQEGHGQISG
jgi:hypothetical protein